MDQICSFIFDESSEAQVKSVIKETYGVDEQTDKFCLKEKVITENKGRDYTTEQKVRADLIKWLLDTLDNVYVPEGNDVPIEELEVSSISEKLALNTLYRYGFIN